MTAPDHRPQNCRFRLYDEGKPYPKSSCSACGATIVTGLGTSCSRITPLAEALEVPEVAALRVALAGLTAVLDAEDEEGDFLISAHGSQTILKRYATEKKNARAALHAIREGRNG